jgi:hypothetical protein
MTKRRAAWVGVAVVAVLALVGCAAWCWLSTIPTGINRRGFDMIQPGMTRQQVEAILSGPPGDYRTIFVLDGSGPDPVPARRGTDGYRDGVWSSDHGRIWVFFDADGKVADKACSDGIGQSPSLRERIRQWLGL